MIKPITRAHLGILVCFIFTVLMSANFLLATPLHLPIIVIISALCCFGVYLGFSFNQLEGFIFDGVRLMSKLLILFSLLGILIGAWLGSGVIPSATYYGVRFIRPELFLPITFVFIFFAGLAMGSPLATVGALGLAFFSIGQCFGIPEPYIAGTIAAAAYTMGRCSPLCVSFHANCDNTGTDQGTYLRWLFKSVCIPFLLSIVLYYFLGKNTAEANSEGVIESIIGALDGLFVISPWMFLLPGLLIFLAFKQVHIFINVLLNITLSVAVAVFVQGAPLSDLLNVLFYGYKGETAVAQVNILLNRGGLASMFDTINLFMIIGILASLLENMGVLDAVMAQLKPYIRSTRSLVVTTAMTDVIMLLLICDFLSATILTGRMFRPIYSEMKTDSLTLSKVLTDFNITLAPIVPWSLDALVIVALLGVPVLSYAPYVFISFILPAMTLIAACRKDSVQRG